MSYTFKLPYNEGTDRPGFGIDVLTNSIKGDGAINNPDLSVVTTLHENGFSHQIVTDNNSYMLAVQASLSGEGTLWGGEQSASAKFMYDSNIDVKSTSYVGNAYRESKKRELDLQNSKLTDAARDYLMQNGPDAFLDAHGLYFVGGFIEGGWCSIYYSMTATTSSDKVSAELAVSAAFGKNKVDVDGALQTAAEEFNLSMLGGADGVAYGNHSPSDPNLCSSYMDILDAANNYMNDEGYEGDFLESICYSWDQLSDFMDVVREYYPDWSYPDLTTSSAVNKLSGNYLQLMYYKKSLNASNPIGLYNQDWKADVLSQLESIENNFAQIDMGQLAKLAQNLNSNRWEKYDVPNVLSAIDDLTDNTIAIWYNYNLPNNWSDINKIYSNREVIQVPNGKTNLMTAVWKEYGITYFNVQVELNKGRFMAKVNWGLDGEHEESTSVWLQDDGMGVESGSATMPNQYDYNKMTIKVPTYHPQEEVETAQLSEANHSA